MPSALPNPKDIWLAVEAYLHHAYGDELPLSVKSQLSVLRAWSGPLLKSPVVVSRSTRSPYPLFHPIWEQPLSAYETRDRTARQRWRLAFQSGCARSHVCPSEKSPDYADFKKLMENNQKLVDAIEAEWAEQGCRRLRRI